MDAVTLENHILGLVIPTLIVWGDKDRVLSFASARRNSPKAYAVLEGYHNCRASAICLRRNSRSKARKII